MTLTFIALLAACSVGYGCGSADGSDTRAAASQASGNATSTPVTEDAPPSRFASLPEGWKQFDDGGALLSKRGGSSNTYATSWDFDPSSGKGPAGDLPDNGVIIEVLLLRRPVGRQAAAGLCRGVSASRFYPPISGLPLQLSDMHRGQLEGAPDVVEYHLLGSRGTDYHVDVRVDLAPDADRAAAQQALNGLRLPRWGDRC